MNTNIIEYLQKELGESFEVSSELNVDNNFSKIPVVVSQMSGNIYDESLELPYLVAIYTSDPDSVIKHFTTFAQSHNNTIINELVETNPNEFKESTIIQYYATPMKMESDIEFGIDKFAKVIMYATWFVMSGVENIKKITIDSEPQAVLTMNIPYTTEQHSNRVSGKELNEQNVKSATTGIQLSMINRQTIFNKKLSQIRQGLIDKNTKFHIELTWVGDNVEQYDMILTESNVSTDRGKLPSLSVSFSNASK